MLCGDNECGRISRATRVTSEGVTECDLALYGSQTPGLHKLRVWCGGSCGDAKSREQICELDNFDRERDQTSSMAYFLQPRSEMNGEGGEVRSSWNQ